MKQRQPTKAVRLSESDRADLRKLRNELPWLWSYAALAEYFGCSRWTAMLICKQAARDDLESAIVCYSEMAKVIE